MQEESRLLHVNVFTISFTFQVVDGTTLYLDDEIPKINEAPSADNVTPSDIRPTVTGRPDTPATQAPEPTGPEIESSVLPPDSKVSSTVF